MSWQYNASRLRLGRLDQLCAKHTKQVAHAKLDHDAALPGADRDALVG
ncbi:MAG: hypothetical protein WCG26_12045 [Chloroflexales bacterium]